MERPLLLRSAQCTQHLSLHSFITCVRACVCVSSALISVMSFAVVSLAADESAVHLPLPPGLILFVWSGNQMPATELICPSAGRLKKLRFDLACTAQPHTHSSPHCVWVYICGCLVHEDIKQETIDRKYIKTRTHSHTLSFTAAVGYDCGCCERQGGILTHTVFPCLDRHNLSLLLLTHAVLLFIFYACTHTHANTHIDTQTKKQIDIFLFICWC